MRKIAPHSAEKGRLRPSFFFWVLALWVAGFAAVHAQDVIYRCGQEYTNAPQDKSRCIALPPQTVTVIEGTRLATGTPHKEPAAQAPSDGRTKMAPAPADSTPQRERDAQARTIVATELEKVRQQHALWQQEYNQGEPVKLPSELTQPHKHRERTAALKAAIERAERDMDSLQRELARRPSSP